VTEGVVILHRKAKLTANQFGRREDEHGLVESGLIWVDEGGGLVEVGHDERHLVNEEQIRECSPQGTKQVTWSTLNEARTTLLLDGIGEGIVRPVVAEVHEKTTIRTSNWVGEIGHLRHDDCCRGSNEAKKEQISIGQKVVEYQIIEYQIIGKF